MCCFDTYAFAETTKNEQKSLREGESNPRPPAHELNAVPTELPRGKEEASEKKGVFKDQQPCRGRVALLDGSAVKPNVYVRLDMYIDMHVAETSTYAPMGRMCVCIK